MWLVAIVLGSADTEQFYRARKFYRPSTSAYAVPSPDSAISCLAATLGMVTDPSHSFYVELPFINEKKHDT